MIDNEKCITALLGRVRCSIMTCDKCTEYFKGYGVDGCPTDLVDIYKLDEFMTRVFLAMVNDHRDWNELSDTEILKILLNTQP